MRLYELSEAYRTLSDLCESGEDFQEALAQIQDELAVKVQNTAKVVLELDAQANAISTELERLGAKKQTLANSVARLKEYLKTNLESAKVDKVQGDVVSVTLQKSPPACEVVSVNDVPLQLRTSVLKIPTKDVPEDMLHYKAGDDQVDKKEVIRLWKEEEVDVPGTKVTQGKHIRIR